MFSILIVDDNKVDRQGIFDLIDWEALEIGMIGMAADGVEGAEKAKMMNPDIVLADINMPEMDGLNMLAEIKSRQPDTACLIMSCFDEFEFAQSAMKLDVSAYFLKPIDLEEMTAEIRELIDSRKKALAHQSELDELRQKITLSLPLMRKQFLREILQRKIIDEQELKERMQYLDYQNGFYCLLYVTVYGFERMHGSLNTEDRYLVLAGLRACMEESFNGSEKLHLVENQHNSFYGVIFAAGDNEELILENVVDIAERVKKYANASLDVPVAIGISDVSSDIKLLPQLLDAAESAVGSRFHTGGDRIILSSETTQVPRPVILPDFNVQRNAFVSMIEQADEQEFSRFINRFFSDIQGLSENEIKSTAFILLELIQQDLQEINQQYDGFLPDNGLVWQKLNGMDTLNEMSTWVHSVLNPVRLMVQEQNSSKYIRIIADIKTIVQTQYASIENVEQVVKPLFISSGYANHLFKEHTGETIFDFLVKTKIEAAKELLCDPYIKVYEICEKVGYTSTSYFSALFKSYTGVTPKQYMNKNAKKHIPD